MTLLWIDLETTGLNPDSDAILEIGVIMTDDKFVELGRFHAVTDYANRRGWRGLHERVREMHSKNGLWMESLGSTLRTNVSLGPFEGTDKDVTADELLHRFITAYCGENVGERNGPQLAGSTVSFDRAFMRKHLPDSFTLVHYRSLDVTSLNELARRFWPDVHENRPHLDATVHRAIPDIEHSLATAKYYAEQLGPLMPGMPCGAAQLALEKAEQCRNIAIALAKSLVSQVGSHNLSRRQYQLLADLNLADAA